MAGFILFGENGYERTSIDSIVKEANISKGSLFYYFESKKNFYLYLYEYAAEKMEQLVDQPGENGVPAYMEITDFFDRLMAVQGIKSKYGEEFHYMSNYIKKAFFEKAPAIREEITKYNQRYIKERTTDFFNNLDCSKFKAGIDPRMVMQLISWCSEGCANQLLLKEKMNPMSKRTTPDFNEVLTLFKTYVDLLRSNFYKEEYL